MIDELEIIKSIVGDLSGVGIWVFVGSILYILVTKLCLYGGVFYIIKLIAEKLSDHYKTDLTKSEANNLRKEARDTEEALYKKRCEITRLEKYMNSEIDDLRSKHKIELEDIKHMYKILKESKNGG